MLKSILIDRLIENNWMEIDEIERLHEMFEEFQKKIPQWPQYISKYRHSLIHLVSIERFEGQTISALKCAIKEAIRPAMDIPISNLDLKIGDSIIGKEILSTSRLQDILESHLSMTNPLIVNASITNYFVRIDGENFSLFLSFFNFKNDAAFHSTPIGQEGI